MDIGNEVTHLFTLKGKVETKSSQPRRKTLLKSRQQVGEIESEAKALL
ncbi:hypothetical protein [Crocosphaera subtropica]|nr:hypothetical protein [Crocosphaera subtropica]